ncbi:ribonucleotide reductase [Earliella scabrosa]|nr:ribonucleotide reductase [Earliella scabrosa]
MTAWPYPTTSSALGSSTQPYTVMPASALVIKRDGYDICAHRCGTLLTANSSRIQPLLPAKLRHFLKLLSWDLDVASSHVDSLVENILATVTTQITSANLQAHAATTIAAMSSTHPDYSLLAGRTFAVYLHKMVDKSFSDWVTDYASGPSALLDPILLEVVGRHESDLESAIVHSRDFDFTYRSIRTLANSYLLKHHGRIIERPQFLYMRVAITIHPDSLEQILETYHALSTQRYTHASPTMFNAGTMKTGLASCYLYQPNVVNYESVLDAGFDLSQLWMADGGIGVSLDGVPSQRSLQAGVMPLVNVYDSHARYTSLCRDRRPSAGTIYLSIWHADVLNLIIARTNRASQYNRWSNLFPAVWIPDVFMTRLESRGQWSLFDPADVPDLLALHGAAFTQAYEQYERSVKPILVIPARDLWATIAESQMESGTPFLLYQDNVNAKNNERHLGTIRSSNLCTEIVQFSAQGITAVCTLSSIVLPKCITPDGTFDFAALHALTKLVVRNTDKLVDNSALMEVHVDTRMSAEGTRAIGIGVQGLADTFMTLRYPYDSADARRLNVEIFETIYHAALDASCDLAQEHGPYPLWDVSPAAGGVLQLDMWTGATPTNRWDFASLRERIRQHGLRNSMLTCQMPTASTSQITGQSESTEPYDSNITTFRVLSGDFSEICRPLVRELTAKGLWSDQLRAAILRNNGSIQSIADISDDIKAIYRTSWEIDAQSVIDMAADRGPFIDQHQ